MSTAWQYSARPHTSQGTSASTKKSAQLRPSSAANNGSRGRTTARGGTKILFKRTAKGRSLGRKVGGRKSGSTGRGRGGARFHDREALQEQLRHAKLQEQHWRVACKKATTKCNSLEAELRKTDRRLEAAMARRGGDASLNNAQMRSEVRRLRDYVQDLQARNAEQDYKIRELEKSTRKTRMTEMEIECEEYFKEIEHLRRALRTESQRVDRSHRTGQATLMTSVRVTEEFKAVKAEKHELEKQLERVKRELEQERFRVVNGQRISTTSVLSMQHERVKSYEKIIMTLKSDNSRLKSELKNAVLGLQREKKDAGKAKKDAEEAALQAKAAKRQAARHQAAANAMAASESSGRVSARENSVSAKAKEAQRKKEEREKKLAAARARGNEAEERKKAAAKKKADEDKAKKEKAAKEKAEKEKAEAKKKKEAEAKKATAKASSGDQGGDDDDYGDDDYGDDDYGDDDYGDDYDDESEQAKAPAPAPAPAKAESQGGDDYDDDDDYGDDFDDDEYGDDDFD